eukprot:TRINITY_DN88806_c0_g1_i1.p1 TRINITY_DN88806_c0_g1~~TRINITY_DN88806_c0_g1_i1.p1  ORF type:complete len:426 (-),score=41.96 TRINITY_DN88806_c0_g1_i1:112-1389(-)
MASLFTWLFVEHFRDYNKWPWRHFNSPERQLAEHPSFVCCEVLFLCLTVISFCHAFGTADLKGTRRLKLLWVATFLIGTLNDYIFMLLPVVDNFWQAQAIIMLTPRMPLYIPCVYNAFMYWPSVAAARVFHHGIKSRLAEACLVGLMGGLFYAPYDVCGARFLWWTWHDTDPGVKLRWLGVPAGSTIWTITFNFSFCYLLRTGADRGWSQLRSLALACLSTPLMIMLLNVFCILGMDKIGMPGPSCVVAAILVFGSVVAFSFFRSKDEQQLHNLARPEPWPIRFSIPTYFLVLALIMVSCSPEEQVSTGAHQEFGPCGMTDVDLMGYPRTRYICSSRYPDFYFNFECIRQAGDIEADGRWARLRPEDYMKKAGAKDIASWYTVCGQPHQDWGMWMAAEAALTISGAVIFSSAFLSGTAKANGKHS